MAPSEGQLNQKVLLVDDDISILAMMKELLERKGFEVVAVGGVTEALKCIVTETFQVLITDLHMPNPGDGFRPLAAELLPNSSPPNQHYSGHTLGGG